MGLFGFGKKKETFDDLDLPAPPQEFGGNFGKFDPQANNLGFSDQTAMNGTSGMSDPFHAQETGMSNQSYDNSSNFGDQYSTQPGNFQNTVPHQAPLTSNSSQANKFQFATPVHEPQPQTSFSSHNNDVANVNTHQLELLSSKLDVIKAMVENLSHRLTTLENKIDSNLDSKKKSW